MLPTAPFIAWRAEKQNWAFSSLHNHLGDAWATLWSFAGAITIWYTNRLPFLLLYNIFFSDLYLRQQYHNKAMHWERKESQCKLEQLLSYPLISQQTKQAICCATSQANLTSSEKKTPRMISFVPVKCQNNSLLAVVLTWCNALIRKPLMIFFCLNLCWASFTHI